MAAGRGRLREGERERPVIRAFYPVAALLVAIPVFDLLSTAWPPQLGNLQWRYGFLGLLANVLLTPMLGAVLASFAAATLGQSGFLKALSITYFVLAGLMGVAIVLFALDVLQLQPQVVDQQITNYRSGAAIAAGKYLLAMVGLVWLGLGGMQSARRMSTDSRV